jgi:Flp pilus assembly protein TadD
MGHAFKKTLRGGNRRLFLTAAATACLALQACQTTGTNSQMARNTDPSGTSQYSSEQMSPGVRYWAAKYEANPKDIPTAINLSRELRIDGQFEEALGVMLRSSTEIQNDPRVLAEMGKTLVQRGSPKEGLALLDQAAARLTTDWSIMSARGVAYDQLERHKEAQREFEKALSYSPDNPNVLANLGLSLATQGRLSEAENLLRRAQAHPNASSQVALNLALIIGLKGDLKESEEIAREHLPPASVEENMAYLRGLLTQPARWHRPMTDNEYDFPEDAPS